MTLPASDQLSRRGILGSLAAIPVIQALQGATATQAQTTAIAPDNLTAIDIALEPDATMIRHAKAANARLLKNFPKGFALDATHHPHVSMLQQFAARPTSTRSTTPRPACSATKSRSDGN